MRLLKQSTAYDLMLFMTQSADHLTGATGLTLTVTASKAGAAFASISPAVTERGNGWYALALTASHTDTADELALHVTAAGADPADTVMQVRANVLGDTLPANVTQISDDSAAADNLEAVLDGTGAVLTLTQLRINSAAAGGAIDIDNSGGPGVTVTTTGGSNRFGVEISTDSNGSSGLYIHTANAPGVDVINDATGYSTVRLTNANTGASAPAALSIAMDSDAVSSSAVLITHPTVGIKVDGSVPLVETDAIPWQPAWDAEVQSEVADALAATNAIAAASVSAAAANKIADHVRRRTQANVEASSDGDALGYSSLYGAIQQMQESNTTAHAGFLTVFRTDGVTELAQRAVTTDGGAEPVTGIS